MPTGGVGLLGEIVISAGGVGVDEERGVSVWSVAEVVLIEAETGFEEFASGEVMLVFDAGDVGGFDVFGIGELRALRGQEGVLVVEFVDQETAGENIAAGEIGLELGEIADAEDMVVVGTDREFGVDVVFVLDVEGVVKPDLSFHDGAGEGEAWKDLVEAPSVLVLHGRDEVGGPDAEVIVANAGVEGKHAGRSFTGFGGLAGRFDADGAEGVGADADLKLSVGGLGDVEAVEQGEGLIGFAASEVRLASLVENDAGDEVEGVAIVVGAGIDHVDDIEAAESLLRGDLGRINGGRGFVDIDGLADFLLAGEGDFDGGSAGDLNVGLIDGVEAFFLDMNLVLAEGEGGKLAASIEIGEAAETGLSGGLNGDAGIADGDSGVIDYGDGGR